MPQSLSQIYLHVVFSTKERRHLLRTPELRQELHGYLAGACRNLKSPAVEVGGVDDHVHLLCRQARTISVADLVRELKRESSKWVKKHRDGTKVFGWQDGYGAFSVSPSHVPPLRTYVARQEAHHLRESFQDEFRRLLKKYGLEWDERYVWD